MTSGLHRATVSADEELLRVAPVTLRLARCLQRSGHLPALRGVDARDSGSGQVKQTADSLATPCYALPAQAPEHEIARQAGRGSLHENYPRKYQNGTKRGGPFLLLKARRTAKADTATCRTSPKLQAEHQAEGSRICGVPG